MKDLWILAGESSGDLYGARLAEAMRSGLKKGETLRISGMGGEKMRTAGVEILADSTELGVMGIVEVLKLLGVFVRIYFSLIAKARKRRPGAVLLIDYPGFNLMFALAMYCCKIPVVWYVSPQLWVWGKWRRPVLAKICRKMLVIFPFETEVYAKTGLQTIFTGHPLPEMVRARHDDSIVRDPNEFLLLPGSRAMEIQRLFTPMLETVLELSHRHRALHFSVSTPREKVRAMCAELLEKFRSRHPDMPEVAIHCGETARDLQRAGTGLAASGTVTVESAVAGLPLTVVYRMNWITILLASLVVRLYRGYFTMVNIIMNRTVFEEFLQHHVRPSELVPSLEKILPGGPRRAEVEHDMAEMTDLLSAHGTTAAERAAAECREFL